MKYFNYIEEDKLENIFYKKPQDFEKNSDKDILKYALGAFLYVPANKYNQIYKSVVNQEKEAKPLAICLEDAIGEFGEKEAIESLDNIIKDDDVILVKASRGMNLEKVVEYLNK